jgi:hypothetical protein
MNIKLFRYLTVVQLEQNAITQSEKSIESKTLR